MPANRPTALRTLLALAVATALLALAVASNAPAANGVPAQMLFPVIGPVSYSDDFGDPRAQGGHEGNDILAQRRAPVIAVEAGRIVFWTRSANAGCMLYLYGRSGASYQYIHLNNDLTARNDNRGACVPGVAYAPGLRDGQDVRAGQLIGYVGDSGDADGLHPHLHFELHPGDGAAVSPYRWLRRAERLKPAVVPVDVAASLIPRPYR
jgi:murein DD-endopeptidase MepM/ murein hydrolase activator NlpD